jgi:uncharacterized protein (UPF0335 family)
MKEKVQTDQKKFIQNIDDLEREKKALFAEVGLDENGEGTG